eukprot:gnl/Spiro4/15072_TR8124_c0_g1_i1.p1 gnl/Spiro4/15072_TR8124_c0_g1~~gnl/Spiro4/15072_TR8124_c0_g1_i1.p1  ORF type:complete len:368 (-),score=114.43 gnl/Spiro4/15072_TR8124_c0_g1_i1:93-1103(-)
MSTSSNRPEDVPSDANEHCPGTNSEMAGRGSACAGCPNQSVCASLPRGPVLDPDQEVIDARLKNIKHKILVLSSKGGVGKSTVSAQLAFALAARGYQVGLLDIDICGPSIPTMLGLTGQSVHQSLNGWEPVYVEDNLGVMSIGFLLPNADDSIIWRGPRKNAMIKQFCKDVWWGSDPIDFLIVDTPPGTSDEHLSITSFFKNTLSGADGCVVVTTPQEVACADVRKEIGFCVKVGFPVVGLVENMSGFVCPNCEHCTEVFTPSSGGGRALCERMSVPFLGRIPLDPMLGRCCEEGTSYFRDRDSAGTRALQAVVNGVVAFVGAAAPPAGAGAVAKP